MFLESSLYAMAPSPTAPGAPAPNPLVSMMPLVIIVAMAYFLLFRPQMKAQKERTNMMKQLKEGDKVVMVSGVYATVVKVDEAEDILTLKIAENVNVKAARSAVERMQK
jgi:preprotein translocase subunit YajC